MLHPGHPGGLQGTKHVGHLPLLFQAHQLGAGSEMECPDSREHSDREVGISSSNVALCATAQVIGYFSSLGLYQLDVMLIFHFSWIYLFILHFTF